jgi:molybdopterin molybdotransferase
VLSVAEAEKQVLAAVAPLPGEDCPIEAANGRVLRQPLVADRDLPPFDRVTMDGYALRYDLWEAGTRRFRVAGVQAAGAIPLLLPAPDACIEVMTGAVLPEGTDVVVPYETVTREDALIRISPGTTLAAGQAIHHRGSDRRAGSVVVRPGIHLGGREIAVAAACGYAQLQVSKTPKIAVVTTGDELVAVGSPVAPHQLRGSNDLALRAALIAAGHDRVERFHLPDVPREIEHRLRQIVAEHDVVVIAGGVSKGKLDFVPQVLEEIGVKKVFHGVDQRPGRPLWFGLSPRGTPVFALPGNPASSYICLHRYVLPALARMVGMMPEGPQSAVLTEAVRLKEELTNFLPVVATPGPRGERLARPAPLNTSGDFAGLTGTSGFVELPADGREFQTDTIVRFWSWR